MDDDGFYMGEIDGAKGLVPSNFLAEVTDQYGGGTQQTASTGRGQRGGRGHGPGARGPPPPPRETTGRQWKTGIAKTSRSFSYVNFFFLLIFEKSNSPKSIHTRT